MVVATDAIDHADAPAVQADCVCIQVFSIKAGRGLGAATPRAHARSSAPNPRMAQVGRPRLLQLLRGTGKPHESGCVSGWGCLRSGGILFAAGARNAGSPGRASSHWVSDGFLNRERSIPSLTARFAASHLR
jgi:hypothetical protein